MPGPNTPYTNLDFEQVLKQSFDEDQDRLRVDAEVTAVIGTVEVVITDDNDSIKIGNGLGVFADVDVNRNLTVRDNDANTTLSSIDSQLSSGITVNAIQSGVWSTGRTWVLDDSTDSVSVVQSTNPWIISGTVTANQGGSWNINDITGTISLPTGASTLAEQQTQITSLQLIDDIVHSQNTSLDKGVPFMGQLDDTSTTIATEDNVSVVRITAQRALHTNLRNNSGTEIATSTNPAYAITQNISGASDLSKLVNTNTMYSIGVEVVAATSGTNNPIILFRNPTGSGKIIYIHKIEFGTDVQNVSVVGKIFSNPTITTNGTAVTIGSRNIGGGASAAVGLINTLPTVSANGTQLQTAVNGQNNNSVQWMEDFSIAINPNNSLLITIDPLSNNRNVAITIVWAEI